ncbi:MAG: PD-(D/E)XK nuclease family protein [Bacteroidales bacterium]|jgi:hypothetical protein|nr:PD-(D/E)XK nuclease family protein [Bacteroidales bacterium]
MEPFLYQVASLFYKKLGREISSVHFVFPNRRAGLFFQKYLSEIASKPLFSPGILTVTDLFVQLSHMQLADNVGLLFDIYDVYKDISHSPETFDDFLFWGEMLLNDFNEVDKYMIDARQLFTNVVDLKEIDVRFAYLTDEQIAIIRRFWEHFMPVGDNRQKQDFLQLWEVLYPVYSELKKRLELQEIGYEGLIFRSVADRINAKDEPDMPFCQLIFVGFNALTEAEKVLAGWLKKKGLADFYWDYEAEWVKDSRNKASFFMKENLLRFPSRYSLPTAADLFFNHPEIEITGIPSSVGQAKEMSRILEQLINDGSISGESAIHAAVVLPNEGLLMPVLHSIPEAISRINVTMGYPLRNTPVSGLMEHIIEMQRNMRMANGQSAFYYKYVLPVLHHRYVSFFAPSETKRLIADMQQFNKYFLRQADIPSHPVFELIFRRTENANETLDNVLKLLEYFQQTLPANTALSQLEMEFIYHYYLYVNRMKGLTSSRKSPEMSVESCYRLLKKLVSPASIPFVGEPLSGLQIMGSLETRALNFDYVIILSVNEGVYPKRDPIHSFIPYNLRKAFGLPCNEYHDSIFAYNFYRLIAPSKRVFLLYDTRTDGMQTGETSRLVYQLKYHYHLPVTERLLTFDVRLTAPEPLTVKKNEHVMQQLQRFFEGGDRALSASAINTYINCPLKFYLLNIEGLSEEEEVSETVEANTFGSMFHQVMQDIYTPLAGHMVDDDMLSKIKKNDRFLTDRIEAAFATYFHKSNEKQHLTGQNFLTGEIIRKYVKQMLDIDRKQTPFTCIEPEKKIQTVWKLPSQQSVQLKGFIDRIDQVKGMIHILDYKTGTGDLKFKNIPQLFEKNLGKRPKDLMQIFMYCLLYEADARPSQPIVPGIIYLRSLFSSPFEMHIMQKDGKNSSIVDNFSTYRNEFAAAFTNCLEEIFSPETPFMQTTETTSCNYCPLKEICRRIES